MPSPKTTATESIFPTCTHWGNYRIEVSKDEITAVLPYDSDNHPTPIGQSLLNALDSNCRIAQPMVRKGYLEKGPDSDRSGRGCEPFVPVSWETAVALAAEALQRTKSRYGNEAIYGGSYGWASAGRFHHAQSQIHRFLKQFGGYVDSTETYSFAAAEVIMPHILGISMWILIMQAPTWEDIIEHGELVVAFGGISMKNTQISIGGIGCHFAKDKLQAAKDAGVKFVNVGMLKDDIGEFLDAKWLAPRPNSDVAIMLGIAHTLIERNLHDCDFLDKYCEGFEKFLPYLMGEEDGQPKDADWAAKLSELSADSIRDLAVRMAKSRTVISVSWSIQRAEHGEQSYWMATTLAAMLGQISLPGGGIAYGYGAIHSVGFLGRKIRPFKMASLPQGENPINLSIPVARISDMLLNPGGDYHYNGEHRQYPDIKLIYWAGGNPFHHHQDINRLRQAWQKPETIIVNESVWTATARHADIVFPSNTSLERNDIGGGSFDDYLSPMPQAVKSFGQSRSDYAIFSALADKLGFADEFTEGRDEMAWLQFTYQQMQQNAGSVGIELPDFDQFWAGEQFSLGDKFPEAPFILEMFRQDPETHPLATPSGKIEIFSETIDSFGYDDCGGHPRWYDKQEWQGSERAKQYPLHLISNQPKTRLHSQFDHGVTSRNSKIKEREPARMHASDAAARNIRNGDIVRIFNDRGACLAGVEICDDVRPGVLQLATGAWYDPENPSNPKSLELHGNPNVLTRDIGTSKLAQGPTAHSCLVEVESYNQSPPPVKAFTQPLMEKGNN